MDKSAVLNIVLVVLCAGVYGVQLYFKTRGSVFESATQLISQIESSGLIGADKMAYVVSKLFAMIPVPLKTIFTEKRLQELAQEVFENMKQYALERAKAIDKKKQEKEDSGTAEQEQAAGPEA